MRFSRLAAATAASVALLGLAVEPSAGAAVNTKVPINGPQGQHLGERTLPPGVAEVVKLLKDDFCRLWLHGTQPKTLTVTSTQTIPATVTTTSTTTVQATATLEEQPIAIVFETPVVTVTATPTTTATLSPLAGGARLEHRRHALVKPKCVRFVPDKVITDACLIRLYGAKTKTTTKTASKTTTATQTALETFTTTDATDTVIYETVTSTSTVAATTTTVEASAPTAFSVRIHSVISGNPDPSPLGWYFASYPVDARKFVRAGAATTRDDAVKLVLHADGSVTSEQTGDLLVVPDLPDNESVWLVSPNDLGQVPRVAKTSCTIAPRDDGSATYSFSCSMGRKEVWGICPQFQTQELLISTRDGRFFCPKVLLSAE